MATEKIWKTTLYLRLSCEDGDKEESNSISAQRQLLRDYISKHPDLEEYAVRVDDGYSGSDFERPAFQAMMEDIKAGRCDAIIVKDLSRFGRNFTETGRYIEQIFPFLGVRFISVSDQMDTSMKQSGTDKIILPFKNLLNETFIKDISTKIRTQLEVKRKNGQFIGPFAVYGYAKDARDKNKLVVDPYAADVVRMIFQWKLEGISPQDIANTLNKMGILSPMEYKRSQGINYTNPFKTQEKATWSAGSILRVLKNPVYIGTLVQGKETTVSYKIHKRVMKDEGDWDVVENNHEAIISREEFECIQRVLKMDTRRGPDKEKAPLLSGLVYCGDCGASMVLHVVPSGKKKYVYYVCSANKANKSCSPHRIRDTTLETIVLESLQKYIRQVVDLSDLMKMTASEPLRKVETLKTEQQLQQMREEYERDQKLQLALFEHYTDGMIDRKEYMNLKANLTAKTNEAEKQMKVLEEKLDDMQMHTVENDWMEEFRKHEGITTLDRAAVVTLIDKILIYSNNAIEIKYRWQDNFEWQNDIMKKLKEKAG